MSQLRDEVLESCQSKFASQIDSIMKNLNEGKGGLEDDKLTPEQMLVVSQRFTKSFQEHFHKGFNTVFRSELTSSGSGSGPSPNDLTITDEDLTQVDNAMTHVVARR